MQHSAPIDRISNLPDELLCHMLSFLPIKLAFTTTLLSKRWASLCYSLTDLRFEFYGNNDTFHSFRRFVDTMMLSPRVANQPIKTFNLHYGFDAIIPDRHSFDAWVDAAKRRGVEKIHLTMSKRTLNPTFFTSQTLVVLELNSLELAFNDNMCVDLPSLKTLHLMFVRFQKKYHFMKLLNACPALENLLTYYPKYSRLDENNEGEEFKTLILSKLVRAEIGLKDVPCNVIKNVEFLRLYRQRQIAFKNIPQFQNLIHIELWFYGIFRRWDRVVELLRRCPKLQILFIKKQSNINLCKKGWECPTSDVECVSSHLRSCTILNFEGSKNDLQFATYILLNARLLEDMTINVANSTSNGMLLRKSQIIEELSSCPRISPGCKLSFQYKRSLIV